MISGSSYIDLKLAMASSGDIEASRDRFISSYFEGTDEAERISKQLTESASPNLFCGF